MVGNEEILSVTETIVPITAVGIVGNHILVGKSSYLCSNSTAAQLKVFKHQAIHHIVACNNDNIAVCGGRSISLIRSTVSSDNLPVLTVIVPEIRLSDWVITAYWVCQSLIAVLFSYNHVALLDAALQVLRTVQCAESCIVYGGCFDTTGPGTFTCWSGTVFNKILFWEPFSLTAGAVLKSFSGHQGVIFDIAVSQSQVFSVSDDRTLIIWDRETSHCLHKLFVHSARPLKVTYLQPENLVVTVGEDCRCIIWSPCSGQLKTLKMHSGNGVRSVSGGNGMIVTGGWDAKVSVYHLNEFINDNMAKNSTALVHGSSPDPLEICLENDKPRWVMWCDEFCVLVNSMTGNFSLFDVKTKHHKSLNNSVPHDFKDYSVPCKFFNFILVGGLHGQISLFNTKTRTFRNMKSPDKTKIYSLTCVEDTHRTSAKLFISSQHAGLLTLWSVEENDASLPESMFTFTLPSCKNRWVTCAVLVRQENVEYLVVGDRKGGVHLYYVPIENVHGCVTPLFSYPGLHGAHGVTKLMFVDNKLQSFGRDGKTRYYKIENEKLVVTGKNKSLHGASWIESIEKVSDFTRIHHFHGTQYKIIIRETGEEVFCVECGGGHRSWDFKITDNFIKFVFIKSGKIVAVSQPYYQNKFSTLSYGSHGLDTHCAIISEHDGQMISVSEDCDIIVHTNSNSNPYCRISNHISSVRTIASLNKHFFTAGGRCSLKAWTTAHSGIELNSDYNVSSGTHISVGYNSDYRFDQRNKDNDQRVVSVDCCVESSSSCFVYCGLSNGDTVLMRYLQLTGTFVKLITRTAANCITKVRISSHQHSLSLFASTTFGMVHIYVVDKQCFDVLQTLSYRLHLSAINGFDIKAGSTETDIVTIGDDGDIKTSLINTEAGKTSQTAVTTAHFTAGISVAYLGSDDKRIMSVGSDQRIRIFSESLVPLFCCYTDVTDPHNLFVQRTDKSTDQLQVVVCGKGIQKFLLDIDLIPDVPV